MPINYVFDPGSRIIGSRFSGLFTTADFVEFFRSLLAEEEFPEGMIEIADFNNLTGIEIEFSDIDQINALTEAVRVKGLSTIVIQAFTEQAKLTTKIFRPIMQNSRQTLIICEDENDCRETLESLGFNADSWLIKMSR